MTAIAKKARELLEVINRSMEYNITEEMFNKGEFPWSDSQSWMNRERFREEIPVVKEEMKQFAGCIKRERTG